jgi:hypothetical protein
MGRPPAGMIDAMTKRLILWLRADHRQEDGDPDRAVLSARTDFQDVAAQ